MLGAKTSDSPRREEDNVLQIIIMVLSLKKLDINKILKL